MAVNMFFYVSLVFISLRLTKKLFFELLFPKSRILYTLLGSILGLTLGTILMLIFVHFFQAFEGKAVVSIDASVQTFFILGTLSPLVKSSHRDIIQNISGSRITEGDVYVKLSGSVNDTESVPEIEHLTIALRKKA